MSAAAAPVEASRERPADAAARWARRNGWTLSLVGFFVLLLVFTKLIQPSYGTAGLQGLAISILPLALAAAAQAIVVISGGIDLSVGSIIALTSVVAAVSMNGQIGGVRRRRRHRRAPARDRPRCHQRQPRRRHARAGHRGHAGHGLRLGGLRPAGPGDARRRRSAVAQGPHQRAAGQPVDPQGGAGPDRRRRPGLDPRPPLDGLDSRSTPSGATRWRPSAAACRSAGRRSPRTP